MKKLKVFLFCSFLVAILSNVKAYDSTTTTMCDASNSHKCTITNVGEATGKLITTTTKEE